MIRSLCTPLSVVALATIPTTLRAAPALVTPAPVLAYRADQQVLDYRPTLNAAGTRVIFERSFPNPQGSAYGATNLFIADLGSAAARRLVTSVENTARADWCWRSDRPLVDGPVAFSVSVKPASDPRNGVYTTMADADDHPHYVGNRASWAYPTWFPGCQNLAVDAGTAVPFGPDPHDTSTAINPGPTTVLVDALSGRFLRDLSGRQLWAGFASINPRSPLKIAFAGQQFSTAGYDQARNYVYVGETLPFLKSRPIDPGASIRSFDQAYEGRAPSWSPDGQWIAFESSRTCANASLYAIFVQDGAGRRPAAQVTDCKYNGQHAKWYREPVNGRKLLVVSVLRNPSYSGHDTLTSDAREIASLDVTDFVTSPPAR